MSDFSAILERLRELEESGHGEATQEATCGCGPDCDHCGGKHTMKEVGQTCKCCNNKIKAVAAEGEACNHTPEGKECPEHGLAECGSMMVTMGEGTKADPEIVRKFAKVSDSKRSYYVMKWAEEQGMDSDEAMELAGYKKGDYRGYGSYNWHYVGESEDAIEECGEPTDMREQRLAQRVIELTQRLQSFKEQLAEMDPAAQDPEEIKKQQTITTNLNQMKAAGVDIDPSKGTEDPAFNKEVGDKVAAAMADPALGQQLKGVLGKVKD